MHDFGLICLLFHSHPDPVSLKRGNLKLIRNLAWSCAALDRLHICKNIKNVTQVEDGNIAIKDTEGSTGWAFLKGKLMAFKVMVNCSHKLRSFRD